MYEIRRFTAFHAWLTNLSDSNARARIAARIDRLALGNPGDVKPVTKATQDADIKRAIEMNVARAREASAARRTPKRRK